MPEQIEGSRAVAETVAACRPEVIAAYPISPQTHIVEGLSQLVKTGELAPCEFINVESEFAAMSVSIGASAAGARAYTATASQGLLFMVEALYNASGLGLPIVMTVANRAIGAPINIWNDHSDSMSQRDSGWIQLYAETNQEAADLHVQAFRLAEGLSLPVMVCMDGFILTHALEEVELPTQEQVDAFLPPFEPRQVLDPDEPMSIGAMVGPEAFMEVKYLMHAKQMQALDAIPETAADFAAASGRDSGGLLRTYRTEDAETVILALGSVLGTTIKYYQVGSFAVGNRLLDPDERSIQADERRSNTLTSGHRACQGCGEALGARYVLDAAMRASDNRLIAANATGCLEVFSTPYPESSWQLPWLHSLFGNAPAVATGIAAAMKVKGRTDVRVIGQGGDGGTVDIGFGCLSGMFERGDDVLFVCYDNEGYMNTGVQRSGATPPAARTATTQAVGAEPGNVFGQGKSAPLIAMAHEIPYVATATIADLRDLEAKVEKAMSMHGPRYLHVLVTCPLGWGCGSAESVKIARLATQCGLFPVFEAEDGDVIDETKIRHHIPVEDYLQPQKRFAHLFSPERRDDVIDKVQARADRNIKRFGLL